MVFKLASSNNKEAVKNYILFNLLTLEELKKIKNKTDFREVVWNLLIDKFGDKNIEKNNTKTMIRNLIEEKTSYYGKLEKINIDKESLFNFLFKEIKKNSKTNDHIGKIYEKIRKDLTKEELGENNDNNENKNSYKINNNKKGNKNNKLIKDKFKNNETSNNKGDGTSEVKIEDNLTPIQVPKTDEEEKSIQRRSMVAGRSNLKTSKNKDNKSVKKLQIFGGNKDNKHQYNQNPDVFVLTEKELNNINNSIEKVKEQIKEKTKRYVNYKPDPKKTKKVSKILNDLGNNPSNGITIETLEKLNENGINIFKYDTVITIHSILSNDFYQKIQNNKKGGYKHFDENDNGSIEIYYQLIDKEKKDRIFSYIKDFGVKDNNNKRYTFNINQNSKDYSAYIISDPIINIEYGKDMLAKFQDLKDQINNELFGGYVEIGVVELPGVAKFLQLRLKIKYIYEENVNKLIESITGYSTEEIDKMKEEKRKETEKNNEITNEKLKKDQQERVKKENQLTISFLNNIIKNEQSYKFKKASLRDILHKYQGNNKSTKIKSLVVFNYLEGKDRDGNKKYSIKGNIFRIEKNGGFIKKTIDIVDVKINRYIEKLLKESNEEKINEMISNTIIPQIKEARQTKYNKNNTEDKEKISKILDKEYYFREEDIEYFKS